jgi:hypothetical protein
MWFWRVVSSVGLGFVVVWFLGWTPEVRLAIFCAVVVLSLLVQTIIGKYDTRRRHD